MPNQHQGPLVRPNRWSSVLIRVIYWNTNFQVLCFAHEGWGLGVFSLKPLFDEQTDRYKKSILERVVKHSIYYIIVYKCIL